MIKIYQSNGLTRKPFFQKLINFLDAVDHEVTLRQIHQFFEEEKHIDREIEAFIQAGYLLREEKHYKNNFPIFSASDVDLSNLTEETPSHLLFNGPFFIRGGDQIEELLNKSFIYQGLKNTTNQVELHMVSRYDRSTPNLINYFYKVKNKLTLSECEQEIYQIMGDVDPEYALKYMTTFLLRFQGREIVKVGRADIFIEVLLRYGLIEREDERAYRLKISFQEAQKLPTVKFDKATDFIRAQIQQTLRLPDIIHLPVSE